MPTDGMLFLENIPESKRYLLTALSVFFSIGSVAAAIVGIVVIPQNSCPERAGDVIPPCDVATQNMGWKYMFFTLTGVVCVPPPFCIVLSSHLSYIRFFRPLRCSYVGYSCSVFTNPHVILSTLDEPKRLFTPFNRFRKPTDSFSTSA